MSKTRTFLEGEIVTLLPFEDQPEEKGVILEFLGNDLYSVEILAQFRKPGDDGLREVHGEQLEIVEQEYVDSNGDHIDYE